MECETCPQEGPKATTYGIVETHQWIQENLKNHIDTDWNYRHIITNYYQQPILRDINITIYMEILYILIPVWLWMW